MMTKIVETDLHNVIISNTSLGVGDSDFSTDTLDSLNISERRGALASVSSVRPRASDNLLLSRNLISFPENDVMQCVSVN